MLRLCSIILILSMTWHCTAAMKCAFSDGNEYTSQWSLSSAVECPRFIDRSDKVFCCLDNNAKYYCCDADEFENNIGAGVVIAIAVGVIVIVCTILCVCCCCCPCCCLYKRRHRGTVYGNMPRSGVQTTVIQVPQPVAVPVHAPMYPVSMQPPPVGMQQVNAVPPAQPLQPGYYPPTYDEATAKQAPFNPNF